MFLKKGILLLYLSSIILVLNSCQEEALTIPNSHAYIQQLLKEEQKSIETYHNKFFSTPQQELRLRKTQIFQPLTLPDSIAFDSMVWRDALLQQYQVRLDSSQKFNYWNIPVQGCNHEKLHICHIPSSKNKALHKVLVWDIEGRLIFESDGLEFELFYLNKEDSSHYPYLLFVQADTRPNHQLMAYSPEGNTFIDKLDHYSENLPATMKSLDEGINYSPSILKISIEDLNKDGLPDINFYGHQTIKGGEKRFVRHVFLYIKTKDIFAYSPLFGIAKN